MTDLALTYNQDLYSSAVYPSSTELNRILSAAIVSPRFRQTLLRDPVRAIENGYQGETFELSRDERACLLSIKAPDLASFADQLMSYQTRLHPYQKAQVLSDPVLQYLER